MINCQICKDPLKEGNPSNIYGTADGMKHRSDHHLFPKRFKDKGYFSNDEIQKIFQIYNTEGVAVLCYECHEEIIHNIILSDSMIADLSALLAGKDKKTRIKIIHEIVKKGIEIFIENKKQDEQ
jgi:hypothetical protein